MTAHRYRRADLAIQPWKNGGGVTREVVSVPGQTGAAGADFDWRVSIAHIAASGPFSSYAGIDRVITLLEGPGVHLRSPDGPIDHRLDTPLAPFAFPGEAAIHADLLGADCHDFNVMTRRDACAAPQSLWPAASARRRAANGHGSRRATSRATRSSAPLGILPANATAAPASSMYAKAARTSA